MTVEIVDVAAVKFKEKDVVDKDAEGIEVDTVPFIMEVSLTGSSLTQAQILSLKPVVL